MPELTCPECGLVTNLPTIRKAADEFCQHCDFPLFWARASLKIATPTSTSGATLRRLPGAGGRVVVGTKVCPNCGELNGMAEAFCTRCAADLDPKPPEPAPAPPPPAPAPPPPPPPPPPDRLWLWILLTVLAFVIVTVLVLWAVL